MKLRLNLVAAFSIMLLLSTVSIKSMENFYDIPVDQMVNDAKLMSRAAQVVAPVVTQVAQDAPAVIEQAAPAIIEQAVNVQPEVVVAPVAQAKSGMVSAVKGFCGKAGQKVSQLTGKAISKLPSKQNAQDALVAVKDFSAKGLQAAVSQATKTKNVVVNSAIIAKDALQAHPYITAGAAASIVATTAGIYGYKKLQSNKIKTQVPAQKALFTKIAEAVKNDFTAILINANADDKIVIGDKVKSLIGQIPASMIQLKTALERFYNAEQVYVEYSTKEGKARAIEYVRSALYNVEEILQPVGVRILPEIQNVQSKSVMAYMPSKKALLVTASLVPAIALATKAYTVGFAGKAANIFNKVSFSAITKPVKNVTNAVIESNA